MKNLCLLLFALLYPGLVSSQAEPCQSLLLASSANPQCTPVGNCTGLRCDQRDNALNGSSASFVVIKCEDPVIVNLTIQSRASTLLQRNFTRNATVFLGSSSLTVAMQRNASYLQFQAGLTSGGGVVIPTVYVPLNASDCMCASLADLAQRATHPLIEPRCSTNDLCDGIYCELDIFGSRYYLEIVVLPCQNALSLLVEDSSRQVLYTSVFNRTETRSIQIGIFSLPTEVRITPYNYSMDIQAFITDPIFSRVEVIPRHKIILDKTNCSSLPNTPISTIAPPMTQPPPVPPPINGSETCHAFFRIIQSNQSEPFVCAPLDQCERGISCRLDILDTHYHVNISLTSSNEFAFIVEDGPSDRIISTTSGQNVSVTLPKPQGGRMVFKQNRLIATIVGQQPTTVSFQLDLVVPDVAQSNQGNNLTTILIPLTTIAVPLAEESCQVLRQYSNRYPQCTTLGTCSGAQCLLSDNVTTFVVTKCVDPVMVNLMFQSRRSGGVRVQRQLNHTDSLFLGGSFLHVEMGRNATDLQFEATVIRDGSSNTTLVPQAIVPLNASHCMCQSLQNLAAKAGGTPIEPECQTNQECNGVVCELDIFSSVYYLENIILPCEYAVDVVVRDSQRQAIFMSVYNRTGTHAITIGFFTASLYVEIVQHDYSMEVSAFLDSIFFGNVTIVPHHTIILDKTSCDPPHIVLIAPPTAPPPPISPPADAPETCHAFFRIIQSNQSEPFVCAPLDQCERGISCRLDILDTHYHVNISLTSSNEFAFVVEDGPSDRVISNTSGQNVNVTLPKPQGGRMVFKQNRLIAAIVGEQPTTVSFQLDLVVPDLAESNQGNNRTTILIPLTTITVPLAEESCQVLRRYSDRYPQCTTLGTCSGAQCQLSDNVATFVATKCADPVPVNLTVQSRRSGEVKVQRQLSHTDSLFLGGSSLYVEMGRNATDLQFEATVVQEGSSNTTLIPQAIVPLNTSHCMCQSLQNLADKAGGTPIEPECQTNQECNGVVCELDILSSVFYLESIILPCEYAVDVVVRDSQRQAIFMSVYNRTEIHAISIGFFTVSLYVEIVRHDYSMEVSAVLDSLFFGNITIVPHHTIILDKTSCHPPHIVLVAPPTAPPPPMPPPPSSPETCKVLYDIIQKAHSAQFFCQVNKDCETGILCTLEILDTFYTVNITLVSADKMVVFSVMDSNQMKIGLPTSKNATVLLPRPGRTALIFNQSGSAEKGSIGFSLALSAPNLGSPSSRLQVYSLIDYSEVPFVKSKAQPQSSTDSTVAIAVPVIIFVVLCFISLLSVLGCMVYCKQRHTSLPFQLQFHKMKDGDQDDFVTLDTKLENYESEPDEVKSDLGNEYSGSRNEDPDRYEKPAQLNTGTIV